MLRRMRKRHAWGGTWWWVLAAAMATGPYLWPRAATAVDVSPFDPLLGRWVGEGRLGVRDNATEQVKCRVTYTRATAGNQLRQSIRCASPGGNVEVQSLVSHAGGRVNGTWKELVRNWSGNIEGAVTPNGFRVAVRGKDLNANMQIVLVNAKQVIEIQFIDSSLIGLTLILDRG
jgi:hypothetical protein